MGLQFGGASGPLVSILVSKAGGRYRLQSDCFPALWLATQVGACTLTTVAEVARRRRLLQLLVGMTPASSAARARLDYPQVTNASGPLASGDPPLNHQELTQRLALHYRAADSKPGAPPPPAEGQLVVSLQEPLPLQVKR